MEKKDGNDLKKHKDILTREYLHSISRIGDRLKMLQRDMNKQKQEIVYMEEDVQLLSDAFDSLFADLVQELEKRFNKNAEHKVEEV